MARTKLNDKQLEKIVSDDKVSGASLNITGSDVSALTTLTGGDHFLVQSGSAAPKKITADTMQDFFSSLDILETSTSQNYQILFADDNTNTVYSESSYSAFQTSRLQESSVTSSTTTLTFSPEYGDSLSSGEIIAFKDSSSNRIAFTVSSSVSSSATSFTVAYLEGGSNATSMSKSSIAEVVKLSASAGSGDGKVRVDGSGLLYNPSTDLLTVGGDISVGDDVLMASDGAVLSLGAGADVTLTHDGSDGAAIAAAGAFDIDAGGALTLDGASITIGGDSDVAVDFDSSTFDLDASGAITIDGTSTLSLDAADSVNLTMAANASLEKVLTIAASNANSSNDAKIDMDADGAIEIDAGAGLSLQGGAASDLTTSSGALTLDGAGGVSIAGNSSEVDITTTGAVDVNGAAITVDASAGLSLDSAADSNFSMAGNSSSAVTMTIAASNSGSGAGVIDMDADGAITVDAGAGLSLQGGAASDLTTGAGALTLDGASGVNIAGNSSEIDITTSGALDLNSGAMTLDASTISLDGSGAVNIDTSDTSSGISIGTATSGVPISIGHGTSEVTVNDNLTVTGDLTINGATTTVSTTNMVVEDKFIELGNGVSGSPSGDAGFVIERGSSDNAAVIWDESADEFFLGTGAVTGASSGDLSLTAANLQAAVVRSSKLEIDGASDYIDVDTDLKIVSAADVLIDPTGGELKVDGNVVPNSDSADSLGASGTAWANLYVDAIDLNGQGSISVGGTGRIDLDADDDTSIRASADDVITFEVAGVDEFQMDSSMFGPSSADGAALGGASNEWADLFLADGAVINLGSDQEVSLTHVADTGVRLNAAMQLQFRDADIHISSDADGALQAKADSQIDFAIGSTGDIASVRSGGLMPGADNGRALGATSLAWSDLYLGDGGVLRMGPSSYGATLTHSKVDRFGSDIKDDRLTSSFSAFQANRIVGSTLSSSTSSISMSPEVGTSIASGTTIVFTAGSDTIAYDVSSSVSSGDSSISVSYNAGASSATSVSVSSISNVSKDHGAVKSAITNSSLTDGMSSLTFADGDTANAFNSKIGSNGTVVFVDGSITATLTLASYSSGSSISLDSASLSGGSSLSPSSSDSIKVKASDQAQKLTLDGNYTSFNIVDHDGSSYGLELAGTVVTATAAELNIMDGDTTASSVTLAAGDGVVLNDGGTMKQALVSDFGTFMAGTGVQVSSGVLSVECVSDIATSASAGSILSSDLLTGSLSQNMVSGSLQVFLNGMLQTPSGSVEGTPDGGSQGALFDYELITTVGPPRVEFVEALDGDDVLQLRYIKA